MDQIKGERGTNGSSMTTTDDGMVRLKFQRDAVGSSAGEQTNRNNEGGGGEEGGWSAPGSAGVTWKRRKE
jgi:hypothetical protein